MAETSQFSEARLTYETPELLEKIVSHVVFNKTGEFLRTEALALSIVPGKFAAVAVVNECIYNRNRKINCYGIHYNLSYLLNLCTADHARHYYLQFLITSETLLPPFSIISSCPLEENVALMCTPLISTFGYALVRLVLFLGKDNPPMVNSTELNHPNLMDLRCSYTTKSKDVNSRNVLDAVAVTTMKTTLLAAINCKKIYLALEIHSSGFQTNFQIPQSVNMLHLEGTHVGEWLRHHTGALRNLRDLTISQILVGASPTEKDFYKFLSACSKHLVKVAIYNYDFISERGDFHLCHLLNVAFSPLMEKMETLHVSGGHWKLKNNNLENDLPLSTRWPAVKDLVLQFNSSSEWNKWFECNKFVSVERLQIGVVATRGVPMQYETLTVDQIDGIYNIFPSITELHIKLGAPETSLVLDYIFERMVGLKKFTIVSENSVYLPFDHVIPQITNMRNLESFQVKNCVDFVAHWVKLTDRSFTQGIFLLEKLKTCDIAEKLLFITDAVRERYLNSYQRAERY